MDWNAAIERNREALKRILTALVTMAGLGNGQLAIGSRESGMELLAPTADCRLPTAVTLPRHLHRAVLRLMRPAESAARRLVIVAARGLPLTPQARKEEDAEPPPARPRKPIPASPQARKTGSTPAMLRNGPRTAPRALALPLFDPLRRLPRRRRPAASGIPRISVPGLSAPTPVPVRHPPSPHDPIDATRLGLRLQAIGRALDDLPGHARRFARWRAARDRNLDRRSIAPSGAAEGRARQAACPGRVGIEGRSGPRLWPLRFGRPPGQRPRGSRRPAHQVHEVLADLQWFAFRALEQPDTS